MDAGQQASALPTRDWMPTSRRSTCRPGQLNPLYASASRSKVAQRRPAIDAPWRMAGTRSPRDGALESWRPPSRTLVTSAQRPSRRTPSQVPPAIRSRPARMPAKGGSLAPLRGERRAGVEFVAIGGDDQRVMRMRIERDDGQAHRDHAGGFGAAATGLDYRPDRESFGRLGATGAGIAYGSGSGASVGPSGLPRWSGPSSAVNCRIARRSLPAAGRRRRVDDGAARLVAEHGAIDPRRRVAWAGRRRGTVASAP